MDMRIFPSCQFSDEIISFTSFVRFHFTLKNWFGYIGFGPSGNR